MITSQEAWQKYTDLANELRSEITRHGNNLLSEFNMSYYFKDNGKEDLYMSISNFLCIGITIENSEILIIIIPILKVTHSEDTIKELSLYNPILTLTDLIEILERIES